MRKRIGGWWCDRSSLLGALIFLVGCGGSGSLSEDQKGGGAPSGDVTLDIGDIAVSPSGDFIVFKMAGGLAVAWLESGVVEALPVKYPTDLAFARTRDVVYVGSDEDARLHAVDVRERVDLWTAPITADTFMKLASSKDDQRVLAVTQDGDVKLLDAATGEVLAEHEIGPFVVDFEILPDDERALIVPIHTWDASQTNPTTVVTVLELGSGAARTFEVPSCADDIVVAPLGDRAFLAPAATCSKVPIAYLDLTPGKEAYVKDLPGFGPVAMASDGATAVGFLDVTAVDDSLFEDPSQKPDPSGDRYHLMVIDTKTLAYTFFAYGADVPRYAITPDGESLLVDPGVNGPARIFGTKTGMFRAIEGPDIELEDNLYLANVVIGSDSAHAYVLHLWRDLYDLDISKAASAKIDVGFEPASLTISPDNKTLFLHEDAYTICVLSLADKACRLHISGAMDR